MPIGTTGINFSGAYETFMTMEDNSSSYYVQVNGVLKAITQPPDFSAHSLCSFTNFNGIVYKYGGYDNVSAVTNVLYSYNSQNNSWTQLTSSPSTGSCAGAFVAMNGKLYAMGGNVGSFAGAGTGPINGVYEYTIATDTWATKNNMPDHSSPPACVYNGLIYRISGVTAAGDIVNVYSYEPNSDTWTALANFPNANGQGAMSVVGYGGYIWVPGGVDGNSGTAVTTCNKYNIASNTWSTFSPLPLASSNFQLNVIGNKMYLRGGNNTNGLSIYIYDFDNDNWFTSTQTINSTFNAGVVNQGVTCPVPLGLGG